MTEWCTVCETIKLQKDVQKDTDQRKTCRSVSRMAADEHSGASITQTQTHSHTIRYCHTSWTSLASPFSIHGHQTNISHQGAELAQPRCCSEYPLGALFCPISQTATGDSMRVCVCVCVCVRERWRERRRDSGKIEIGSVWSTFWQMLFNLLWPSGLTFSGIFKRPHTHIRPHTHRDTHAHTRVTHTLITLTHILCEYFPSICVCVCACVRPSEVVL